MGKKVFIFITIATLLLIVLVRYTPITLAEAETIVITGDVVNVREQPGTTYPIITQIRAGETFQIEDSTNDWYQIKLDSGEKGWVANWLTEKQSVSTNKKTGIINVDHLNIRSEPSLSGEVLGKLHTGDEVKIVDENNGWSQIEYNSKKAWASSKYIDIANKNEKVVETTSSKVAYISTLYDSTNIRKKPALKSDIVEQVSAGVVYEVLEKSGDWFKVEYSSGKTGFIASWIVSRSEQNIQISHPGAKTIVIDPGHGGRDEGARGAKESIEKELTMNVSNLLATKLRADGYNVILSRASDQYISLQDRVYYATKYQADAFISIHFDSIEDRSVRGHTTYYYQENDTNLAQSIHQQIEHAVDLQDRGVRFGNYYVLRENPQPSVLLELGYISNPKEESTIKSEKYLKKVANAIHKGLDDYFSN